MARQLRINYPGAFYHVTSRGKETDKEIPATKAFAEEASMEEIFETVDKIFLEGRLSRDVKQYPWHI